MRIVARTDKGMVRDNNQDSYVACELQDGAVLAIVCDGMGGAAEGALASSEAVKAIKERITERYYGGMTDLSVRTLIISSIEYANKQIYDLSLTNEKYEGMGTTVVAAIVSENFVYIAHAGDSRAYMISDGKPTQLTKDHSVVQRMIENGEITPEEAESHPSKHIITRAMGVDSDIKVDFCQEPFDEDDILLLCSDGLTNYVDNSAVTELTEDGCYYDFADRLVNLANQNGGGDNITVVTVSQ
jgi:protein phosphatase